MSEELIEKLCVGFLTGAVVAGMCYVMEKMKKKE